MNKEGATEAGRAPLIEPQWMNKEQVASNLYQSLCPGGHTIYLAAWLYYLRFWLLPLLFRVVRDGYQSALEFGQLVVVTRMSSSVDGVRVAPMLRYVRQCVWSARVKCDVSL